MKRIALIDLDGTVANYDAAMVRDLNLIRSPDEPEAVIARNSDAPYMKIRAKIIRSQAHWWENLEPIKAGFDVVDKLKAYNYNLHVLTKAPHNIIEAYTGKVRWCQKYLPGVDITITHDKGLVYGSVLFDDWVPYIDAWLKWRPRGLVIMPAQIWNEGFKHSQVVRYNGGNMPEVCGRLEADSKR